MNNKKLVLFPYRYEHRELLDFETFTKEVIDVQPLFMGFNFETFTPTWADPINKIQLKRGDTLDLYVTGMTPALTWLIKYWFDNYVESRMASLDYFDDRYNFTDKDGQVYDVTSLSPCVLVGLNLFHYNKESDSYVCQPIFITTEEKAE